MDDHTAPSIYPTSMEFTLWQRVRLDVLRMEYVLCSNTATRGGGYHPSRGTWSGPYWWWLAWVLMHLKPASTSWAVPHERRQIHRVMVPPSVRTWLDWVLGIGSVAYAVAMFARDETGIGIWFSVMAVSGLVVVPRLRGATRSAS